LATFRQARASSFRSRLLSTNTLPPDDGCNMPHQFLILVLGVLVRIILIIVPAVTLVCCIIRLGSIF
jgi:hypothetical protein